MKKELQEVINKLPVLQKAHIYEPKLEDVVEVAYKVGREDGVKFCHKQFDENLPEIIKGSRQKGIKEVVEWVEDNHSYCTKTLEFMAVNKLEWQAQKKEWGIEK